MENNSGLGALLAQGSGKEVLKSKPVLAIINLLVLPVVLIVLCFIFGNELGYIGRVRTELYYSFVVGGFVLAALVLGGYLWRYACVWKTEVYVHENRVKGCAMSSKALKSIISFEMLIFELEYAQITSVNVTEKRFLSIGANNQEYLIPVINAEELMNTINEKLREAKAV